MIRDGESRAISSGRPGLTRGIVSPSVVHVDAVRSTHSSIARHVPIGSLPRGMSVMPAQMPEIWPLIRVDLRVIPSILY